MKILHPKPSFPHKATLRTAESLQPHPGLGNLNPQNSKNPNLNPTRKEMDVIMHYPASLQYA